MLNFLSGRRKKKKQVLLPLILYRSSVYEQPLQPFPLGQSDCNISNSHGDFEIGFATKLQSVVGECANSLTWFLVLLPWISFWFLLAVGWDGHASFLRGTFFLEVKLVCTGEVTGGELCNISDIRFGMQLNVSWEIYTLIIRT